MRAAPIEPAQDERIDLIARPGWIADRPAGAAFCGGMNAQCDSYLAPCSIQARSNSISRAGTASWPRYAGGMRSDLFVLVTRL